MSPAVLLLLDCLGVAFFFGAAMEVYYGAANTDGLRDLTYNMDWSRCVVL